MKRYATLILFSIVLFSPFALRALMKAHDAPAPTAAFGGTERLVIITPHTQDIRREFATAFRKWHIQKYGQAVDIDYRVPGGTNDIKRQLEKTYQVWRDASGKLPAHIDVRLDMVWGGGDYFFDRQLKPLEILQPLGLDPAVISQVFPQPTLAGVALYDQSPDAKGNRGPPTWVGTCLSSFGIVYNPELYQAIGIAEPSTWQDLTDERLAGNIALADPTRSGSAAVAFMAVIQRAMADAERDFKESKRLEELGKLDWTALAKGKTTDLRQMQILKFEYDELKKRFNSAIAAGWKKGNSDLLLIAANARYFSDSSQYVSQDVGNGQAAVGMSIDFYGRFYQETVGDRRCKFVAPVAATVITPDPIAILAGVEGKRYLIARHFVEFILSQEGQRLWIVGAGSPDGPEKRSLHRPPIRRDVYKERANWTDYTDPFVESGGFNNRPEFTTLFVDTQTVWGAAWMDSRTELESARDAILAVKDHIRRAALRAELADLPISMEDVARYQAERKVKEVSDPSGVDEWKANRRIDWANLCRKHYNDVREKATAS